MVRERICGRTEWNESGKRADGANCDRVTIAGAGELAANSGDEHESIVGWAFQPNNETDLGTKTPRGIDAWSVSGNLFMCIPFELLIL